MLEIIIAMEGTEVTMAVVTVVKEVVERRLTMKGVVKCMKPREGM
jgi:hypothetical protein